MASSIPAGGGGRGGDSVQVQARGNDLPGVQAAQSLPAGQAVRGGNELLQQAAANAQAVRGTDAPPPNQQQQPTPTQQQVQATNRMISDLTLAQVVRGSDLPPGTQIQGQAVRGLELSQLPGGARFDEGVGVFYSGSVETVPFPNEGEDAQPRKKTTSFKITNVFLSRPPSNDGDESAEELDDLEDSHTEDLSEMADSLSSQLEPLAAQAGGGGQPGLVNGVPQGAGKPGTPGAETRNRKFSNDKGWDQDAYQAHPGFGFVTFNQDTGYQVSYVDKTTGQLPIAGTMAVIVNNNSEEGSGVSEVPVSGPQDFKNRFKIVKVETTEPLKRGRWTCFDFVDKPASKDKVTTDAEKQAAKAAAASTVTTTTTAVSSTAGSVPASNSNSSATTVNRTNSVVTASRPASVAQNLASVLNVAPSVAAVNIAAAAPQQQHDPHQQRSTTAPISSQEQNNAAGGGVGQPAANSDNMSAEDHLQSVEGGRGGRQPSGEPQRSSAVPSNNLAFSNHPSHSLTTQQNISSLTQVQSPSGMAAQLLGQVIRLPDGQLAQVALAPFLPHQSQQGGGNSTSGANYNNQTILLQTINSAQSNLPHKGVVMNNGGPLLVGSIVAPGQQQQQQSGQPPSQSQSMGATGGAAGQTVPAGGGGHPVAGGQTGPAGGGHPVAGGQTGPTGGGHPVAGQPLSGQQGTVRSPPQAQPSGNGPVLLQHNVAPSHQNQNAAPHQTQQNLQHSQIQTKSTTSSQPQQAQPSQQQQQKPAQGMTSHNIPAATVQQQASKQPQSNNLSNNNTVQVGQLPQQPSAVASSSSQNGIHSGQQQQVLPSAVTSTQQQQPLQVVPSAVANNHQQQHSLAPAAGSLQQQLSASNHSQQLSNSSSSNQQQQQPAASSQQQQAQNNSLQYNSQQVPVVVSLQQQQSQQTRASQQQQLNNSSQQQQKQPLSQQHGGQVLQQQFTNNTSAASAHVPHVQQNQSINQQNFHQQPQQLVLQQFSQQPQPQQSSGSGFTQLHNNQLSSQAVSGQNSKQQNSTNSNSGVITLTGYTSALPSSFPHLIGGVEGGEGLVEQLEISLLQDGTGDGEKAGAQDPETDSSTGSGQGTIDNRIEQAMDLVKSHLMSAVRSEVEELREKITKLEESVTVLSRENEYLRANANQDVLATMGGGRTHQPSDNNLQ